MIVHMTSEISNPSTPKPQEEVIRGRYALTDEERAGILEDMEEARKTLPAYRARMEAACRLTPDTMSRRFTI